MIIKLNKFQAEKELLEEDIGTDIPPEYLDPIMNEIMNDPVMLPSSKIIVDRITIIKHLLSDNTDPYNREPLSKEDLIT